jgi:hypothetical protein
MIMNDGIGAMTEDVVAQEKKGIEDIDLVVDRATDTDAIDGDDKTM